MYLYKIDSADVKNRIREETVDLVVREFAPSLRGGVIPKRGRSRSKSRRCPSDVPNYDFRKNSYLLCKAWKYDYSYLVCDTGLCKISVYGQRWFGDRTMLHASGISGKRNLFKSIVRNMSKKINRYFMLLYDCKRNEHIIDTRNWKSWFCKMWNCT